MLDDSIFFLSFSKEDQKQDSTGSMKHTTNYQETRNTEKGCLTTLSSTVDVKHRKISNQEHSRFNTSLTENVDGKSYDVRDQYVQKQHNNTRNEGISSAVSGSKSKEIGFCEFLLLRWTFYNIVVRIYDGPL